MKIEAGRFYQDGREVPAQTPDVWVCRRLEDFPDAVPPIGARVCDCSECGKRIAYNPARKVRAPKVCMQCAGITPEPIV